MKLNPLNDHVVIETLEEQGKTESGLFLPDTAGKDGPEKGTLIAVGPGRLSDEGNRVPMSVKKGDKVLFRSSYNSSKVKVEGKEYLIIREEDILAILG